MPELSLDLADAIELREMLEFISGWLAGEGETLGSSLQSVVGVAGYDLAALRLDVERFVFLLGGGGEALFGEASG